MCMLSNCSPVVAFLWNIFILSKYKSYDLIEESGSRITIATRKAI